MSIDYSSVGARERTIGHLSDAIEQAKWLGNIAEAKKLEKQLADFEAQSGATPE